MSCKRNGCDKSVTGKALYCSGACRTQASRVSVTPSVTDVTVTPEDVTVASTVTPGGVTTIGKASLEHYHAQPDLYIPRSEPDKLNWGPWMNSDELSRAGLKANRVSIPGDWDHG